MSIKPLFKLADIRKHLNAQIENIENEIEAKLTRVGNMFVSEARQKADFTDRTGNLRSSIGYILLRDGAEIVSDFEQTKDGSVGEAKAIEYAQEIASQYNSTFALIVVAGMEYAAAVESRGFDVLTGSSIEATNSLNNYLKNN